MSDMSDMSDQPLDQKRLAEARGPDWPGAIGAAIFSIIAGYVVWASVAMSPQAAAFPRAIGGILLGLSLIQLLRSLMGRSSTILEEGVSLTDQSVGLGRRALLVATMLAWAVLFPVIGFVVTSFVAALILTVTAQFGRLTATRLLVYLACITVMVAGFYLLMVRVLHVPLPRAHLF